MKSVFIINPAAGKGTAGKVLPEKIIKAVKTDYEIYISTGFKDAQRFARERAKKCDPVNIFACGGDGTLCEVINGVMGYDHVNVGVIPCGTGNDFVKNFGGAAPFLNIKEQLKFRPVKVDVIKYNDKYSINLCNIGLDADVADKVVKFRDYPLISGNTAYNLSLANVFFKKMGVPLKVEFDDGETVEDIFLINAFANGQFYGGGYHAAPLARVDDGLLDVCLVKKLSRLQILKMIGIYKVGKHLEDEQISKYIFYKKCKRVTITPKTAAKMSVDGEVELVDHVQFEAVPMAINFLAPEVIRG